MYRCPICGRVFGALTRLKIHFVLTHSKRLTRCPACGTEYENPDALHRHIAMTGLWWQDQAHLALWYLIMTHNHGKARKRLAELRTYARQEFKVIEDDIAT